MATNFLATAGTNGFLTAAPVTTHSSGTTTINSVASAGLVVSTGVFNQTNTANGLMGYVELACGSSFAPTASPNWSGWWLLSPDGGTTYETTNTQRPPDFVVAVSSSTALSQTGLNYFSQLVQMPWSTFKVLVQNNTGATMGTSGNALTFMTVAVQY